MTTSAREILKHTPLIDGHNDLPWQFRRRANNHIGAIDLAADTGALDPPMHTDIPRLRRGQVGTQFWALYVPCSDAGAGASRVLFEQFDVTRRLVARYDDTFALATCADDIIRHFQAGKIASVLAVEGGHAIENSLAVLRQAYVAGARYMTLTHNENIDWADSGTDKPRHGGLTPFGKEVVREMNRIGMMVDLSHVSVPTMHDAIDTSEAPVIFSHSGACAVCDHPRNVPDDVLERISGREGLVMMTFVPTFVSKRVRDHQIAYESQRHQLTRGDDAGAEEALDVWVQANPLPRATLQQVADHIDHLRDVVGVEHIGIGSDFDGITMTPEGLEDVSTYPALFDELLGRGYSADDVAKIAGRNLLRVMREVEAVGAKIDATREPSEARIDELDA